MMRGSIKRLFVNRTANLRPVFLYDLLIGIVGLGMLLILTPGHITLEQVWLFVLFLVLSGLVKRAGFHVATPVIHSLVGVVDLAVILIQGPIFGGWVSFFSEAIYLSLRKLRHASDWNQEIFSLPWFNGGLKAMMALIAGGLYLRLGGQLRQTTLDPGSLLLYSVLFITWFLLDHLAWAIRIALLSGWNGVVQLFRVILVPSLIVELAPLPLSILMSAVFAGLNPQMFLLLCGGVLAASVVVQRLAGTLIGLRQRVREMSIFTELAQDIVGAQLDRNSLCELAYDYCRRVTNCSYFLLQLLDEKSGNSVTQLAFIAGKRAPHPVNMPSKELINRLKDHPVSLLIPDWRDSSMAGPQNFLSPDLYSGVFIPLTAGQKFLGILTIQSAEPAFLGTHETNLLAAIGAQISIALQNADLYAERSRRVIQLSTISEVGRQVTASITLEEFFDRVVHLIKDNFGYDYVQIYTVTPENREVALRATTNPYLSQDILHHYREQIGGPGIVAWVAGEGKAALVDDVRLDSRYLPDPGRENDQTRAELAVPVKLEDQILGVLDVQSNEVGAFDDDDVFVVSTLGDHFAIAMEEADLYKQSLERQRLEQEMQVGRQIQASLLPEAAPELPGWEICATWHPARQVAGDFYDFIPLRDGRLGTVIADVSDKGVPAALFMALSRTLIRAMGFGRPTAHEALERANDLILADTRTDMFVTVFYAILEPESGRLTYANAGHNPPLLFQAGREEILHLRGRGIALGVLDAITLEDQVSILELGDVLVLYTDGVTDALNRAEEEFGLLRVEEILFLHHHQLAQDILAAITEALTSYIGDEPQFDDYALVIIKRVPKPGL
ncbi:MAG: GAF domain-containing protein [Chloroflexi bacterium]|nr:GAF domain-containing protein [Chloroflexota bacterium]